MKIDLNGNVLDTSNYKLPNYYHLLYTPIQSKFSINHNGNFVYSYSVRDKNSFYDNPYLCEISADGDVIFDTVYTHFVTQDSLVLIENNFEVLNEDSSYLCSYLYSNLNTDPMGIGLSGYSGVLVFKIDKEGTILWQKKYFYEDFFIDPAWTYQNVLIDINPDFSFTLGVNERRFGIGPSDLWNVCKFHVIECDKNGNEINHKVVQNSTFTFGTSGIHKFQDSSMILSFIDSYYLPPPAQPFTFCLRPNVAKVSSSNILLWKTTLSTDGGNYPGEGNQIEDFVVKNKNIYTAIIDLVEIDDTTKYYNFYLSSIDVDSGKINWQRKFNYFVEDSNSHEDPYYSINDIDTTFDNGFILAGTVFRPSQNFGNIPRQYGYLLKVNCLGFLGNPIPSVSVISSNLDSVVFLNNSVQAGSYVWDFGDGQCLNTSEFQDTIVHYYDEPGFYTVRLIANGCNSINEVLEFTHNIAAPPQDYGENAYLTVFPNPVSLGQNSFVYIGNIESTHDLIVTDIQGKIVNKFNVSHANSTYVIPTISYTNGIYTVSLLKDGEVREVEKLIIE